MASSLLTRQDLLELEASQMGMVRALQACVIDRSITAANRQLAREVLVKAERQLERIRAILDVPEAEPGESARTSIGEINERMGWGPPRV